MASCSAWLLAMFYIRLKNPRGSSERQAEDHLPCNFVKMLMTGWHVLVLKVVWAHCSCIAQMHAI
jgi:hypothetical protein